MGANEMSNLYGAYGQSFERMHSNASIFYSFISMYLSPIALVLAGWMMLMPFKALRDIPASVFVFINSKVMRGFPKQILITTIPVVFLLLLTLLEYTNMHSANRAYMTCKVTPHITCDHPRGL